jgi:hypothetical protein
MTEGGNRHANETRLTEQQLRDLETFYREHGAFVPLQQLFTEFKAQRKALDTLRQFVQMFSDAEGTVADVKDLVSDLKEVLDGVGSTEATGGA